MGNDSTPPDTGGVAAASQYLPWPLIIVGLTMVVASLVLAFLKRKELDQLQHEGYEVTYTLPLRPLAFTTLGLYLVVESTMHVGSAGWWFITVMSLLTVLSFVPDRFFVGRRGRRNNRNSRRDDRGPSNYRPQEDHYSPYDDRYDDRYDYEPRGRRDERGDFDSRPPRDDRPRGGARSGSGRGDHPQGGRREPRSGSRRYDDDHHPQGDNRPRGGGRRDDRPGQPRQDFTRPVEDTRSFPAPPAEPVPGRSEVIRDGRRGTEPGHPVRHDDPRSGQTPRREEQPPYYGGDADGLDSDFLR